jgi:hypothetical protein
MDLMSKRKRSKPYGFADLAGIGEDARIKTIVAHVERTRNTVAVVVDDEPGKPERYAEKLRAAGLVVEILGKGPAAGMFSLRAKPADVSGN